MAKPLKRPVWDTGQLNTVEPTVSHQAQGWLIPAGVPEKPTLEEYNHWMNNVYLWLEEVNEIGMLEWDAVTTYRIGSYVQGSDDRLYRSQTAGNQNNDPVGDPVNWADVLNDASALVAEIKTWPLPAVPAGFLECDGSAISRTTYADLFGVLGTAYGIGDGATTFNLPAYQGEFLRGFDNGAAVDPDAATRTDRGDGTTGDNVGTKQGWQIEDHDHVMDTRTVGDTAGNVSISGDAQTADNTQNTNGTGGNQTNPTNVYVMYLIKY